MNVKAWHWWWLTPVILAMQEAEIRRITVQGQSGRGGEGDFKTHFQQKKLGIVAHACFLMWEA
jgi:hypothetical protein